MSDGANNGSGGGSSNGAGGNNAGGAANGGGGMPWHNGVEPETLGFWQNKALDLTDPKAFATGITKMYRDAEKFIGAPPDQLLRMPKADAKPEELRAFYQRLGAPSKAEEYDFSAVKFADGTELDEGFVSALRGAFDGAFVPKDKAPAIASAIVKFMEGKDTAEKTLAQNALAEQQTMLAKNWGGKDSPTYTLNHMHAMEGARRLGITPEAVKVMEGQIGFAATMEAMRKIGAHTSESAWVSSAAKPGVGPANVTTREGAMARRAELMSDSAWGKRYLAGGAEETREMTALLQMIDPEAA